MNLGSKLAALLLGFLVSSVEAQQTIPFQLKPDNRIYTKVQVNGSKDLNFVFDLGANITVINKARIESNDISINFKEKVLNNGLNGSSEQQISSENRIKIGEVHHKDVKILGITYPENETLDGIIGWNLFKGKTIKINFEDSIITVYDDAPKIAFGYVKSEMKFVKDLPYVKTCIHTQKGKVDILAMIDTGYNQTFSINHECNEKHKLHGQFPVIGEATTRGANGKITKAEQVLLPRFAVNGFEIYNMPAFITKTNQSPFDRTYWVDRS